MRWDKAFRQFTRLVLRVITPTRSFLCDSHPWLCIHCKMLREKLKLHRTPNIIKIYTVRGAYVWSSVTVSLLDLIPKEQLIRFGERK